MTNKDHSPLLRGVLSSVYQSALPIEAGKVYEVPGTEPVDPEQFGMSVVTMDGISFNEGDTDTKFALQSASKPFSLAVALTEMGDATVFEQVGVEPSGEAFNSINLPGGKAPNPLVNSGALTVAALLIERWGDSAPEKLLSSLSGFAGADLEVDHQLWESEVKSDYRNWAISYLLKANGIVDDVEKTIRLYLMACSVQVTTSELATMSATLANIGKNPITNVQVLDPESVRSTVSIMCTCGAYDYAGMWMKEVGLPMKSGVSGCITALVNRQLGVGLWSPRIDDIGNSPRGIAACRGLSEELGLHFLDPSNIGSSVFDAFLQENQ